jgi:hypothetical protein
VDELAPLHVSSPFYKTDAFRRGENVLDPIARERLAGFAGQKLLHLQCHFGLDTLSLARMGAEFVCTNVNTMSQNLYRHFGGGAEIALR